MKSVIVTMGNSKYLDAVKQLFSSIYHNSGWKGDYLFLHRDVQEKDLEWFKSKGILLKKISPIRKKRITDFNPIVLDKLEIFKTYFKRWDHVIYLDADMTVNASIDALTKIDSFASVPDMDYSIRWQFYYDWRNNKGLYKELSQKYNLKKTSFNVGIMSFPTKIIKSETYNEIIRLFHRYKSIVSFPEQAILNLFFYDKWYMLPYAYNFYIYRTLLQRFLPSKRVRRIDSAIIFHYVAQPKIWKIRKGHAYDIWNHNFIRHDEFDIQKRIIPSKIFSREEIDLIQQVYKRKFKYIKFDIYLRYKIDQVKVALMRFDRSLGKIGIYLKTNHPFIYRMLGR
ncbi:hypothetical protein H6503_02525 [Candidatus Woesearchaeota archaeon]|nr:hypothetical protein [Candidatus Woesearchaeota archaeon]